MIVIRHDEVAGSIPSEGTYLACVGVNSLSLPPSFFPFYILIRRGMILLSIFAVFVMLCGAVRNEVGFFF